MVNFPNFQKELNYLHVEGCSTIQIPKESSIQLTYPLLFGTIVVRFVFRVGGLGRMDDVDGLGLWLSVCANVQKGKLL